MNSRLKISLVIIGSLILISGILFYVFYPSTEATSLELKIDRLSIFAYPDKAIANGKDQIKIIAIVKNKQNPVSGAEVFFKTNLGELSSVKEVTDSNGQAVVYLASEKSGQATLAAIAGTISRQEVVTFSSIK